MRYWVSWVESEEDYRPITWPPPSAVKGYWCSGYDADEAPIVCAVIDAENEEQLREILEKDWRPVEGDLRFVNEKADDFKPGDRFPIPGWAKDRWPAERSTDV